MKHRRLAIIGGGDLGQLIAHHARLTGKFEVTGFIDDTISPGQDTDGIPCLGSTSEIQQLHRKGVFASIIVGIGYKHMSLRKKLFEEHHGSIPFSSVVHSSTVFDPSTIIGDGVFILPGVVLDRNVDIGNNVLLNTGCIIAHDSRIEAHTFVGPGLRMAGFSSVGASCVIGIGTVISDNIKIADGIRTGAGAVVTENLNEAGLYIGVPAKIRNDSR